MSDFKLKLLTEWTPLSYTSNMIKESREKNDGKIVLRGVRRTQIFSHLEMIVII